MNYEQLRNAGFPFEKCDAILDCKCGMKHEMPTLEEIIEACGTLFWALKFLSHPAINEWQAEATSGEWVKGKTPTEAVARLWLALNKPAH